MLIQSVTALATTTFIPLQIQPAGPTAATSSVHDNGEQDELKNFRDRKVTEAEGEEEQDLNGQEKNEVAYGMEIEAGEAGTFLKQCLLLTCAFQVACRLRCFGHRLS